MFQDSVPAGSYNDPFLSSVCVCVRERVVRDDVVCDKVVCDNVVHVQQGGWGRGGRGGGGGAGKEADGY